MELCLVLCGSLDGRGVWGRMDTCIRMAETLHCSPEAITTLSVNWLYTNTKSKVKNIKYLQYFLLKNISAAEPKESSLLTQGILFS